MDNTHWTVMEMSSGENTSPEKPFFDPKYFFEWQVQENKFDFAITSHSKKRFLPAFLNKIRTPHGHNVITTAEDALHNMNDLKKSSLRGYELIFATTLSPDELEAFFKKHGYHCDGYALLGDRSKHDVFYAAWNDQKLMQALSLAKRLNAVTLCCFAHDADPVYIISKNGQ